MSHLLLGEILLSRPAGRQHVQHCAPDRAHGSTGPLGALSTRATQSGGNDSKFGVRQVDPFVGDPRDDQRPQLSITERLELPLALVVRRLTANKGYIEGLSD